MRNGLHFVPLRAQFDARLWRPDATPAAPSRVRHPILGRRGDRQDTSAERIIGAGVAVGMDGHEIDRHTAR